MTQFYYPKNRPKAKVAPTVQVAEDIFHAGIARSRGLTNRERIAAVGIVVVLLLAIIGWRERDEIQVLLPGGALVSAGQRYPRQLGPVYAEAWRAGAEALESGKSPGDALRTVKAKWVAGKESLFEQAIAPELDKIVPSGKDKLTDDERAALAKGFRNLARGLERPR